MALHPEIAALVDQLKVHPPLRESTPDEIRTRSRTIIGSGVRRERLKRTEDRTIPGPAGDIPIRLYIPEAPPRAIILYLHGGGWVIGDLDIADFGACLLANRSQCALVSVDYRLAPEFPFPAGLEDSYAALLWCDAHRAELANRHVPLIVAGESAGGNLAASVSLLARDRLGPRIALQILIYPITDFNLQSRSYIEQATGGLLTADDMQWYWSHYIAEPAMRLDPLASPLRQETLAGVAPALIQTAFYDPLRDEGRAYADRLRKEGVPVFHTEYAELSHGYFNIAGFASCGEPPIDDIGNFVRARFPAPPPG